MSLTDAKIRTAKPQEKPYRLSDSGGLYLEIQPSGGKWWRLKYRFCGKERRLSLGTYPEVPLAGHQCSDVWLKGARDLRDEARRLLANGIDPSEYRKQVRAAKAAVESDTFQAIALECFEKLAAAPSRANRPSDERRRARNRPETKARKVAIMERDVFPQIGRKPVSKVSAPEILEILRKIEKRGSYEIAARVKMYCNQVFRYAVSTGRAETNPVTHLKEALATIKVKHHAAIIEPKAIGGLLRAIEDYKGNRITKYALRFAPIVFVRPGELRKAEWTEFYLDQAQWEIPGERMKMREPLIVPLPRQAIAILRELHAITGRGRYAFPSPRSSKRPMSDNAVLAGLRRMGYTSDEMTGHGFRAMARTVLQEVLGYPPEIIELQLAHAVKDTNGRAYNRTTYLPQRREMMQKWADYLDSLRVGGELILLNAA